MQTRLDSYLSAHGFCSRRGSVEFLKINRVCVDDKQQSSPGFRFDPEESRVLVNGSLVEDTTKQYYLINKPKGVVTTVKAQNDERTIIDIFPIKTKLVPVGRLDKDSHGLVLMTNDGQIVYKLTHPRYEVEKEYLATIKGHVSSTNLHRLRMGVRLKDLRTKPAKVVVIEQDEETSCLSISITEGKYHQIRRMMKALNLELIDLKRIRMATLSLSDLPYGKFRELTSRESRELIDFVARL